MSSMRHWLPALLLAAALPAHSLELEDCRIDAGPGTPSVPARCGTLTRPLDPDGGVDGEIELRIALVPALNLEPMPDPVVPIAGGPGQSSVSFYLSYATAFEPLRRDRDILLIDQRGTGESATMDCGTDDELATGQLSTELTIRYTRECLDGLPHNARFFTTSVAVRDLDAVRVALGLEALNLYGISYGTRVAQHYARRYPEATRSVILDGVVPPQIPLGPEIATESQRAVGEVLARCAADPDCGAAFPDIAATFDAVLATLRDAPVSVDVPNPSTGRRETLSFGPVEFGVAVRLLAYHPRTIALLPLLVSEAGAGRYEPLAAQFAMTAVALDESLAIGMHNSVMCAEDVPYYDDGAIDQAALEASYMGRMQLDALEAICSVWPRGPIDDDFHAPLEGDVPVLLLSGSADPITPPRYAVEAMRELVNTGHIVNEHQGHGQAPVGCMPDLMADFVHVADPSALETDCLERAFVMPFFVDFTGPAP